MDKTVGGKLINSWGCKQPRESCLAQQIHHFFKEDLDRIRDSECCSVGEGRWQAASWSGTVGEWACMRAGRWVACCLAGWPAGCVSACE